MAAWAADLWQRIQDDALFRWCALAALPPLWTAIAWVDARFLLLAPLPLAGAYAYRRFRPAAADDELLL